LHIVSLVYEVVSNQQTALTARSEVIIRLREEVAKLTAKREAMGEGARPTRNCLGTPEEEVGSLRPRSHFGPWREGSSSSKAEGGGAFHPTCSWL